MYSDEINEKSGILIDNTNDNTNNTNDNSNNTNYNTNNNSNKEINKNSNGFDLWNLFLKYYKQIILILLVFVIIYAIEHINRYNTSLGIITPAIPTLINATPIKRKPKGKK